MGVNLNGRAVTVAAPCSNRTWTVHAGMWTIQANQAASNATAGAVATINTSSNDAAATVTLAGDARRAPPRRPATGVLTTRGDNRLTEDHFGITAADVDGHVLGRIPWAGQVLFVISSRWRSRFAEPGDEVAGNVPP